MLVFTTEATLEKASTISINNQTNATHEKASTTSTTSIKNQTDKSDMDQGQVARVTDAVSNVMNDDDDQQENALASVVMPSSSTSTNIAPDKTVTSKLCRYAQFPNHPQSQHRKPCGTPLMKNVQLASGCSHFVPHLIYCYKSIIESLQNMILREGFIAKCEQWRDRNSDDECYEDVYNGNVRKEFQTFEGKSLKSTQTHF